MDPQPLASFVDPRLEARPFSDQRLVRYLDRTLVEDDEARGRQRPHNGRDAVPTELVECRTTTRVDRLARFDEPEEHRARQLLVRRVELIEHAVCRRRDRPAYTSGRVIAVQGESATVPSFPRRMQRVGEERKGARFAFDLGDEHIDEPDFDAQPGRPRRFGDRATELVGGHRTEQHLISRDSPGEPGVVRTTAVEVRSQRDRNGLFAGEETVDASPVPTSASIDSIPRPYTSEASSASSVALIPSVIATLAAARSSGHETAP